MSEEQNVNDETVKDNPIKCRYCGREISAGEERHVRIRENREWCEYVFCAGKCAGYYQMGCEG